MADRIVQHPVLGDLHLHPNARARRFTFRPCEGGFRVTTPVRFTLKEFNECVESLLPRLVQLQQRQGEKTREHFVGPDFSIDSPYFKVRLQEASVRRVAARYHNGELTISYPPQTRFEDEALQQWLVKVIEESMRHCASTVLVARLRTLAERHGFQYAQVKIHKTRGRWGSCSSRKNINLSLYLMVLPVHLSDYVMLHELCHTLEMNHGPRFWAKMDEVTGNKAQQLRAEMRKYDTSIFS